MTIRYKCEECGSVLNIKDDKAGTKGRCPKCKAEFLVPRPDEETPVSASAESSAAAAPVAATAEAPAKAAKASNDLSDDDIEKILEDDDEDEEYEDEDDDEDEDEVDDEYGVADDSDDDDDTDSGEAFVGTSDDDEEEEDEDEDEDEEADDDDEEPPLKLSGNRRAKAPVDEPDWEDDDEDEPPRRNDKRGAAAAAADASLSAAGIAQGLMARGEKGAKIDYREEKKAEKKGGRPFGGSERDGDDDEGFSITERFGYFAKYLGPAVIGIAIGVGAYWWWFTSWQRGKLPDLVTVTGVVTLDGSPLPMAEVHFHPQTDPKKPNLQLASSVGITDEQGRFNLIYINNVLGAVPGKHRVQVYATGPDGKPLVPAIYNAASRLNLEVKPGVPNDLPIELSSKPKDAGGGQGGFSPPPR